MKIYSQRLNIDANMDTGTDTDTGTQSNIPELLLPFETRQKSRFKASLPCGEAIGVDLPRDGILRDNSIIATATGECLRVKAQPEPLMQVAVTDSSQASDAAHFTLMKAAYHLGNRHVPVMLTPDSLLFEPDHVLEHMLVGLGVTVTPTEQPFEPESGAYQHHGEHGSSGHGHEHH